MSYIIAIAILIAVYAISMLSLKIIDWALCSRNLLAFFTLAPLSFLVLIVPWILIIYLLGQGVTRTFSG